VFRTYEPARDRLVAVKVFRLDITPEQAQALADELSRAAEASLFHPSIVEPIAAGIEGTVAYRAEEYVAAETLDVAMRHYAPATVDKVLPFITQLAGAVDFARAAGVGHGALHPRDVFVTPEEARATGFGVVDALDRVGLRAPIRRPYSAPERIDGQKWGTPADVFSLAAITYELFTGRRPSGPGAEAGGMAGSVAGPQADALHAVIARGLDADPSRRYPTALAFAAALEEAAQSRPGVPVPAAVPARPAAVPPPAPPAPVAAPPPPSARAAVPPAASVVPAAPVLNAAEDDEDAIALERDEDEAHHELSLRERAVEDSGAGEDVPDDPEAEADRLLIDAAAVASDSAAERAVDEMRPAPPPPRRREAWETVRESVGDPREPPEPVYRPAPAVVPANRSRLFPMLALLSLGVLVGFAVGFGVGSREPDEPVPATASSPAPGASAPAPGRDFSEQVVAPPAGARPQPPAVAPPIPSEAPADPARPRPSPPAATSGRLVVRSTPDRAGVTVNGTWRGRTPLTLERLPFGNYVVRVVQPGYTASREEFALTSEDSLRTLSVRLQRAAGGAASRTPAAAPPAPPAPSRGRASGEPARSAGFTGSIYVDSRPRGARVLVDGRPRGITPVTISDLPIGSHVVRLELEDHRPWTASRQVSSGQQERVTGSLERIR
jgi:hypothetical protein